MAYKETNFITSEPAPGLGPSIRVRKPAVLARPSSLLRLGGWSLRPFDARKQPQPGGRSGLTRRNGRDCLTVDTWPQGEVTIHPEGSQRLEAICHPQEVKCGSGWLGLRASLLLPQWLCQSGLLVLNVAWCSTRTSQSGTLLSCRAQRHCGFGGEKTLRIANRQSE
jgi:hypothetical protein